MKTSIAKNLLNIRESLPESVTLVAVSKTKPNEMVLQAYDAGQRIFGENRVQELRLKSASLPKDIQWHMIGHLQRNKAKQIAPFISCIHSIDSIALLSTVNTEAVKHARSINVLLQFHIAQEESKFGLSMLEAKAILSSTEFQQMENIQVIGVMGMATFTDDQNRVRHEFRHLKEYFDALKHEFFADRPSFCEISMGMSGDFRLAVEEGSTMVRVGSAIFGNRS